MDTPQIQPEKEPRYVLRSIIESHIRAADETARQKLLEKNVWYIHDLQKGFKSDLYSAAEALALLQWLEERQSGYEWTPVRLRGILRS